MKAEELTQRLDARAREWVREVQVFDCVTSTNDALKDAARRGAPEGTVAVAQMQTAGRGRHGRAWLSVRGNLFLSFLLRPRKTQPLALIPLGAGVAVAEALEVKGLAPRLKWPNDVLLGGRKVAGILAEASSDAAGIDSVVVGIGVNVSEHPSAVHETATSLARETGCAFEIAELGAAVLGRWALWYDALRRDPGQVCRAWRERSLPWWGRTVEVSLGAQALVGTARDIDENGALLLETASGDVVAVVSGDARELRAR